MYCHKLAGDQAGGRRTLVLGKPAVTHGSLFFCSRTTLLVQLTFEGSRGPSYLPGEHLGIFPANQTALVQGILERVVDCPTPHQTVCLEVLDESGELLDPDKPLFLPPPQLPSLRTGPVSVLIYSCPSSWEKLSGLHW